MFFLPIFKMSETKVESVQNIQTPVFFINANPVFESEQDNFIKLFNALNKQLIKEFIGKSNIQDFTNKEIAYFYFFIVYILGADLKIDPYIQAKQINKKLYDLYLQGNTEFTWEKNSYATKVCKIKYIIIPCNNIIIQDAIKMTKCFADNDIFQTENCFLDINLIESPIKRQISRITNDLISKKLKESDIMYHKNSEYVYLVRIISPVTEKVYNPNISIKFKIDNDFIFVIDRYLIDNKIVITLN